MKSQIVISLIIIFFTFCGNAQEVTPNATKYPRPKVILMMLHLSTNKIEALKRRGLHEDISLVMQGDKETNESIMKDFAQHFTFCPIYFFYDTCYEKAIAKQWGDIVFYDYESLSKKKLINVSSFSNYYLAEVGYASPTEQLPVNNELPERRIDRLLGDEDAVATRNNGINLYDEDFKPIRGKLGFTDISLRLKGPILGKKVFVFEGAAKFNRKLETKYGIVGEKPAE